MTFIFVLCTWCLVLRGFSSFSLLNIVCFVAACDYTDWYFPLDFDFEWSTSFFFGGLLSESWISNNADILFGAYLVCHFYTIINLIGKIRWSRRSMIGNVFLCLSSHFDVCSFHILLSRMYTIQNVYYNRLDEFNLIIVIQSNIYNIHKMRLSHVYSLCVCQLMFGACIFFCIKWLICSRIRCRQREWTLFAC